MTLFKYHSHLHEDIYNDYCAFRLTFFSLSLSFVLSLFWHFAWFSDHIWTLLHWFKSPLHALLLFQTNNAPVTCFLTLCNGYLCSRWLCFLYCMLEVLCRFHPTASFWQNGSHGWILSLHAACFLSNETPLSDFTFHKPGKDFKKTLTKYSNKSSTVLLTSVGTGMVLQGNSLICGVKFRVYISDLLVGFYTLRGGISFIINLNFKVSSSKFLGAKTLVDIAWL